MDGTRELRNTVDRMDIVEDSKKQDKTKKKKFKKQNKMISIPQANDDNTGVAKTEAENCNTPQEPYFPPTFSVSEIKNKQRRHLMFMKLKQEKRKVMQMKTGMTNVPT